MSDVPTLLSTTNSHPRDKFIQFKERGHVYTVSLPNNEPFHPVSTTTLIHKFFPHFDAYKVIAMMIKSGSAEINYPGMSTEEIKKEWDRNGKESRDLGTLMHNDIELYLNDLNPKNKDSVEFSMFKSFWKDFQKEYPEAEKFRTEWLIYDEQIGISGSIDFVVKMRDDKRKDGGKLGLIDWKRCKEIKRDNKYEKGFGPCKHLDNCNFNHYSLQLNVYRRILERNYGVKIDFMMLVIFHPDQPDYQCIVVEKDNKTIDDMFETIKKKERREE